MERKEEKKEKRKKSPSKEDERLVELIRDQSRLEHIVGVVLLFLSLLVVIAFTAVFSSPKCVQLRYLSLSRDTFLIVTSSDFNYQPAVDFLAEHNVPVFVYNIDTPYTYIAYGDRNIPLIPPTLTLPLVACYDQNNQLVGVHSVDLNAVRLLYERCRGGSG